MFKSEDLEKRLSGASEYLKAKALAQGGQVKIESLTVEELAATVAGSGDEPYRIRLDSSLSGWCDCVAFARSKERRFCKHLCAAALVWLNQTSGGAPALQVSAMLSPEVLRAIAGLSDQQCREALQEAAALHRDIADKILSAQVQ